MTSRLMKALRTYFSMTFVLLAVISVSKSVLAAPTSACGATASSYPSFCSIPASLETVKSPGVIHAEVLDTRLAGRGLVEDTAPSTYTLDGTANFAERAIAEAAPPPPMTTPSRADTEAFAKEAKASAIPSKHPR